jgi:predicted SPOUT superfamily RNA methylase MTH1
MYFQISPFVFNKPADGLTMTVKIDQNFIDPILAAQVEPNLQHGYTANWNKALGDAVS